MWFSDSAVASGSQVVEERSSIWAINNPDDVEGTYSKMNTFAAKWLLFTLMGKTPKSTVSEISSLWQVIIVRKLPKIMASSSLSGENFPDTSSPQKHPKGFASVLCQVPLTRFVCACAQFKIWQCWVKLHVSFISWFWWRISPKRAKLGWHHLNPSKWVASIGLGRFNLWECRVSLDLVSDYWFSFYTLHQASKE